MKFDGYSNFIPAKDRFVKSLLTLVIQSGSVEERLNLVEKDCLSAVRKVV